MVLTLSGQLANPTNAALMSCLALRTLLVGGLPARAPVNFGDSGDDAGNIVDGDGDCNPSENATNRP